MTMAMHVTRFAGAPEYRAPGHYAMRCLRVQGMEAGPSSAMWMAISTIAPGGGIAPGSSPLEKIYVVLEGSVEMTSAGETVRLETWDSCRIAPGADRALVNSSDAPATILLAMENAPPSPA
jgi:quercetin dioxygenase-like cupin family protein